MKNIEKSYNALLQTAKKQNDIESIRYYEELLKILKIAKLMKMNLFKGEKEDE